MNWDASRLSQPIDRVAARGCTHEHTGFDPESKVREWDVRSDAPLPLREHPALIRDMRGFVCGRLTVIGYFDSLKYTGKKQARGRWVVRCVCGYYETRRASVLLNPEYAKRARCTSCERTREIIAGRAEAPLPILHRHDRPKSSGEQERTARPKVVPPLMKLYDAIVRGSSDLTLSNLADASGLPRDKVREHIDALVKCGALRERADGWYARGTLTVRTSEKAA